MKEQSDIRKTLSQNIKKARAELHITQKKLAEYSGVSVPHMVEIEQCKTWVSDKTLTGIAKALNKEVYELLFKETDCKNLPAQGSALLRQTAELIKEKKSELRKTADEVLDSLMLEIIRKG